VNVRWPEPTKSHCKIEGIRSVGVFGWTQRSEIEPLESTFLSAVSESAERAIGLSNLTGSAGINSGEVAQSGPQQRIYR
jgi:hypothetical protein